MGSRKKPVPPTEDNATDQVKFDRWCEQIETIYQGIAHWAFNRPCDIGPSLTALELLAQARYQLQQQTFDPRLNVFGHNPAASDLPSVAATGQTPTNNLDGLDASRVL